MSRRAVSERNNNQPPWPGIRPDYETPVAAFDTDGEMRIMR